MPRHRKTAIHARLTHNVHAAVKMGMISDVHRAAERRVAAHRRILAHTQTLAHMHPMAHIDIVTHIQRVAHVQALTKVTTSANMEVTAYVRAVLNVHVTLDRRGATLQVQTTSHTHRRLDVGIASRFHVLFITMI